MQEMELWCYLHNRMQNILHEWADEVKLSKRDRAKLNQKLDRLRQMDYRLATGTGLLAGPIKKSQHIYKLVIHGDVMMRPMLCRGPVENHAEYTLLAGALEKDRQLDPQRCIEQASGNREKILKDPTWRRQHERIPAETNRGTAGSGIS